MADANTQSTKVRNQPNLGSWISRGWDILTADMGKFLLFGLIYIVVVAIASSTVIGEFLVMGPLQVGLFLVIFAKMRGEEVKVGDIAKGFNFFVAAVLSNILISVFSAVGFLLCIIPGIIVTALYVFTPAFIAEKNLDFWEAMEASRNLTKDYVFEMVLFVVILGLINFIGVLLCGIGIIFTLPLTYAAIAVGYDELEGINKEG
jgi:uncharacterized membrane protein